jgi:hypothetical protein
MMLVGEKEVTRYKISQNPVGRIQISVHRDYNG